MIHPTRIPCRWFLLFVLPLLLTGCPEYLGCKDRASCARTCFPGMDQRLQDRLSHPQREACNEINHK